MKDDAEAVAVSVVGELRGVMKEMGEVVAKEAELKRQLEEQHDALKALNAKRQALLDTLSSALWDKP